MPSPRFDREALDRDGGIILAVIINGLVLIQVSATLEYVVSAVALLGAATVDSPDRPSQALEK